MAFVAGQILTAQMLNDTFGVAVNSIQNTVGSTTATSYTATLTGGTTCSVVFVAPLSGAVLIVNTCGITASSSTQAAYCTFEIRRGGTPGSGTILLAASDDYFVASSGSLTEEASRVSLITGLTPGTIYNCRQLFRSTSGSAAFEKKELIANPRM